MNYVVIVHGKSEHEHSVGSNLEAYFIQIDDDSAEAKEDMLNNLIKYYKEDDRVSYIQVAEIKGDVQEFDF